MIKLQKEKLHSITAIYIYPVKSCGVVSLNELVIDEFGPKWDRHWMLVDEGGRFISQRTHSQLSQVSVEAIDLKFGRFKLSFPQLESVEVSPLLESELQPVKIWQDDLQAFKANSRLSEWFSKVLQQKCFLVENCFENTNRKVKEKYGDCRVQFADGFPVLLIGSSSLDLLNEKLGKPISILRFRPNLLVETNEPHIEDNWSEVEINQISFSLVKKCSRCNMVNVNPKTGEIDPKILKTLLSYRKKGTKVNFGQNLIHKGEGIVRIGDSLKK